MYKCANLQHVSWLSLDVGGDFDTVDEPVLPINMVSVAMKIGLAHHPAFRMASLGQCPSDWHSTGQHIAGSLTHSLQVALPRLCSSTGTGVNSS
jgi:hypothetical protein